MKSVIAAAVLLLAAAQAVAQTNPIENDLDGNAASLQASA